jgi:DNA helicase HerA-like ATPase
MSNLKDIQPSALTDEIYERRARHDAFKNRQLVFDLRKEAAFTKFTIDSKLLLRHILVLGSTGSGKTTHSLQIVRTATKLPESPMCLVIDVKNEYGVLSGSSVLSIGGQPKVRFNPLVPPGGVEAEHWDRAFADVFTRSYGLSEPSRRILLDSLFVLRHETKGHPTLRELEREVANFLSGSPKESNSKRSLESRLHIINTGPIGISLNTEDILDVGSMTGKTAVFEIGDVDSLRDQRFLAELLLIYFWQFDKCHLGDQAERLRRLIVVEEAHRYLSEERPPAQRGDRTLLELAIAEARRYGWGFLIVDQMPLLLSRYVWDNMGTVIAHRLTNVDSCEVVEKAIGQRVIAGLDEQKILELALLMLPEDLAFFRKYVSDPMQGEQTVGVLSIPETNWKGSMND